MPRIREFNIREIAFIILFVSLNVIDLMLTAARFDREVNPFAVWMGREIWTVYKIVTIPLILWIYVLDIWTVRQQKWLEGLLLAVSVAPLMYTLIQMIALNFHA